MSASLVGSEMCIRDSFLKAKTTKRGGTGLPNLTMDSTHCIISARVQVFCATSIGGTPLSGPFAWMWRFWKAMYSRAMPQSG
eukprot:8768242-Alexandrium_andersonii.AAC.1